MLRIFHMEAAETQIQRSILQYLHLKKIFCWRNNSTGIYDSTRDIYRKASGVGYIKGVADILGVLPDGKFLAIEVKSSRGRVSKEQVAFLNSVIKAGGLGFVARSIGDVEQYMKDYLRA